MRKKIISVNRENIIIKGKDKLSSLEILGLDGKPYLLGQLYQPDGKKVNKNSNLLFSPEGTRFSKIEKKKMLCDPNGKKVSSKEIPLISIIKQKRRNLITDIESSELEEIKEKLQARCGNIKQVYLDYSSVDNRLFLSKLIDMFEETITLKSYDPIKFFQKILIQEGAKKAVKCLFSKEITPKNAKIRRKDVEQIYSILYLFVAKNFELYQKEKEQILELLIGFEKKVQGNISYREGTVYLLLKSLEKEEDKKIRILIEHLLTGIIVHSKNISKHLLEELGQELILKNETETNLAIMLTEKGIQGLTIAEEIKGYLLSIGEEKIGIELEYLSEDIRKERIREYSCLTEIHPDRSNQCFEIANMGAGLKLKNFYKVIIDLIALSWEENFLCWNSLHLHFDIVNVFNEELESFLGIEDNSEEDTKPATLEIKHNHNPQLERDLGNSFYYDARQIDAYALLIEMLAKQYLVQKNSSINLQRIAINPTNTFWGLQLNVWTELLNEDFLLLSHTKNLFKLGGKIYAKYEKIDNIMKNLFELIQRNEEYIKVFLKQEWLCDYLIRMNEMGWINKENILRFLNKESIKTGFKVQTSIYVLVTQLLRQGVINEEIFNQLFDIETIKIGLQKWQFSRYFLSRGIEKGVINENNFANLFNKESIKIGLHKGAFSVYVLQKIIEKGWINKRNFNKLFDKETIEKGLFNWEFSEYVLTKLIDKDIINKTNYPIYCYWYANKRL